MKYFIIPYAVTASINDGEEYTISSIITWKCDQYPNQTRVEEFIKNKYSERLIGGDEIIGTTITGAPVPISKKNYEEWIR